AIGWELDLVEAAAGVVGGTRPVVAADSVSDVAASLVVDVFADDGFVSAGAVGIGRGVVLDLSTLVGGVGFGGAGVVAVFAVAVVGLGSLGVGAGGQDPPGRAQVAAGDGFEDRAGLQGQAGGVD